MVRYLNNLANLSLKQARKIVIAVIGFTIILIGLALLVLPGPGIVVLLLGLAVLATEFVWAKHWLGRLKSAAADVQNRVGLNNMNDVRRHWRRFTGAVHVITWQAGEWLRIVHPKPGQPPASPPRLPSPPMSPRRLDRGSPAVKDHPASEPPAG